MSDADSLPNHNSGVIDAVIDFTEGVNPPKPKPFPPSPPVEGKLPNPKPAPPNPVEPPPQTYPVNSQFQLMVKAYSIVAESTLVVSNPSGTVSGSPPPVVPVVNNPSGAPALKPVVGKTVLAPFSPNSLGGKTSI
jgi:hypothetical protein